MPARELIGAEFRVLASAKQTIASPATTAFDWGSPNDLYVPSLVGYDPGDRLLLVCSASTAGSTSTLTWVVQDADDSSGSIGTPATAVTDGTLAGGTGDDNKVFGIRLQNGRPWLRVAVTHATATDSFVCHVNLLAVASGL